MAIPVIMPRQGQSVETCIISKWLKNKGDNVKKGDLLFSYETDKASFEVEAEEDGVLLDIFHHEGEEVPVLVSVAVIGKEGEDISSLLPAGSGTSGATGTPSGADAATAGDPEKDIFGFQEPEKPAADIPCGQLRISPRARMMASVNKVSLDAIRGSGPNGRIIVRDIESALQAAASGVKTTTGKTPGPPPEAVTPAAPFTADYEDRKLTTVRKLIARAMHESLRQSAQLTHHMSADARRLLALRSRVKADMDKGSQVNVTLNDMVCFAVIRALEKFPVMNSHYLGESIRTFRKVHLGLAVDTERGLMVPALRDAGDLSLKGLSLKLQELAGLCRRGTVNPDLLSAGAASFTVSNLGGYGVEMFTPIINLPQVAILGVNTITYRPADLGGGTFGFVPVMGLSLTYDHRAVDGGSATLFLREIKDQIENFSATI